MRSLRNVLWKFNIIVCFIILFITGCTLYDGAAETMSNGTENQETAAVQQKGKRTSELSHSDVDTQTMSLEEYTVEVYLETMTTKEKVAQMIFLHYRGESKAQLSEAALGGIILFGDFFQGKDTNAVVDSIQAMQDSVKLPMLIGVDEEGGTVVRVSKYAALVKHKFQSPQELYNTGGMEAVVQDARDKSQILLSLGINVNLAPVADVSTSSADYIYQRSFGKDANQTADYVSAVVSEMKAQGIGSVLKHFPGYGNNRDTHSGFAYDERPYTDFEEGDFIPFQAGIAAGADSVLVSHNIVSCIDDVLPASLSVNMHEILRETMGFQGVIMTDDLVMDAISQADFGESPAVLAVLAGNDMFITTDYKQHTEDILQAVENGVISEETLDAAVRRVLLWKMKLGLLAVEIPEA